MTYAISAKWWDDHKAAYPFLAETPTTIDPSRIDPNYRNHASCVMRPGVRTWGFRDEPIRDAFVRQYGATEL